MAYVPWRMAITSILPIGISQLMVVSPYCQGADLGAKKPALTEAEVFQKRLRAALDGRGVEGQKLAEMLGGMDPGSISKWLTGVRKPPGKKRQAAIERFLDLPTKWLSGGVKESAVDFTTPLKKLKGLPGGAVRADYAYRAELALGVLSRAFEEVAEILRTDGLSTQQVIEAAQVTREAEQDRQVKGGPPGAS